MQAKLQLRSRPSEEFSPRAEFSPHEEFSLIGRARTLDAGEELSPREEFSLIARTGRDRDRQIVAGPERRSVRIAYGPDCDR